MAVSRIFYPYPTLPSGWLSLSVELVGEVEGVEQLKQGSISARDAAGPFDVKFVIEFGAPNKALKDLGLTGSQSDRVSISVVESGIRSRRRERLGEFPLDGESRPVVKKQYDPADSRGDIEVQAFLTYTGQESEVLPGTRCAESGRVLVHFDGFEAPPGLGIQIRWVDFTKEDQYADVQGELFVLDLLTEPPVLLLNEGLPDLKATLMSRSNRGDVAQVRNAQFTLIESQVWNVMITEALSRLADAGSDEEDIADHLGGWRSHVLRGWAPSLMNDRDANISDLAGYMGAHPDELILNILPRQIQLRTGAGKSFSGLIGDFTDRLATEETDGA